VKQADPFNLTGRLTIEVTDVRTGALLDTQSVPNLVTLAGRNLVRDHLTIGSNAVLSHYAVGTGTTAAIAGDTALGNELLRDAVTQRDTNDGEIVVTFYLSSTQGNGNDLTEAGVFTAASGGVLFARTVFSPITKTSDVAVTFTHTLSIGAS
jgi:hypothetical protein